MDFRQRNLYIRIHSHRVYFFFRVCSLYEIGELSARLYLRIHGVERTRASCEIRRLVYHHENKRKNRGGGKWRKRIHRCVLHDFITRVSSRTVRNNRGNISSPIQSWKILATTTTKSFRFFSPSIETIVPRFNFIISNYRESVWISILFFHLKESFVLYIMIELCGKISK